MTPKKIQISDLANLENSLITILARYKNERNRFGIFYRDPESAKLIQLFSDEFAKAFKALVADQGVGRATGALVGKARTRIAADHWNSDTIERSIHDKNSIYRGIARIISKEDGIPVFIGSTSIVGNLSPALGYFLRGNPTKIRCHLAKHNLIQKNILWKIEEGKPLDSLDHLAACYCAGEGFKSDNRLDSIRRRMDKLTFSASGYGQKLA